MIVADEVLEVAKKPRGRPRKFPEQPPKPKPETPKRGRGRPKKDPKGRGRPKKRSLESDGEPEYSSPKKTRELDADEEGWGWTAAGIDGSDEMPKKRGPGRPKKSGTSVPSTEDVEVPLRKRGRPKKDPSSSTAQAPVEEVEVSPPKRKRGRPKKDAPTVQAPVDDGVKKRRGRPPKNPLASPSKPGAERDVAEEVKLDSKGVMTNFQALYTDSESEAEPRDSGHAGDGHSDDGCISSVVED